jgi:hypothetical protein
MQDCGFDGPANDDDHGCLSVSISSTTMLSVAVTWPVASSVIWEMENRFSFRGLVGSLGPSGGATPGGPLNLLMLKMRLGVCTCVSKVLGPSGDEG